DFLEDWPQYKGALFKSAFSLSNTGESISLKDKKLALIDSAAYSASEGGSGDGNSLHKTVNGFTSGAPDPGVYTDTPPSPIVKPPPAAPPPAPAKLSTTKTTTKPTSAKTTHTALNAAPPTQNAAVLESLSISPLWFYA